MSDGVNGSVHCNLSVVSSCRYHRHAYGLGEHYNSVVPKK